MNSTEDSASDCDSNNIVASTHGINERPGVDITIQYVGSNNTVGTDGRELSNLRESGSNSASKTKQPLQPRFDRFEKSQYAKYFVKMDESANVTCIVKIKGKGKEEPCNSKFKLQTGTYYNLRRHLKDQHELTVELHPVSSSKQTQLTLREFQDSKSKYAPSHPMQQRVDNALIGLFADGVPFDIVSMESFREFCNLLNPRVTVKARRTLVDKMKSAVVNEIIPANKLLLQAIDKRCCHFSCDVWSSSSSEGILCILAHFIDETWTLKQKVLLFDVLTERQNGEYIRSVFLQCLADYGVSSDWGGYVISDNASNMKKAFNMTELSTENWRTCVTFADMIGPDDEDDMQNSHLTHSDDDDEDDDNGFIEGTLQELSLILYGRQTSLPINGHLFCAAHTLQLAINDGIKSDHDARNFLNYVNKIMVFFKRSPAWRNELRKIVQDSPKPCVKTRWNSNMDMLDRFRKQEFFSAIRTVLDRASIGPVRGTPPTVPTLADQQKAQELYNVLKPLGDATNLLQGDGPTSNLLILSVTNAFRRLLNLESACFETLRVQLMKNLKLRMESYVSRSEYVIAALIDPRIKTSVFSLNWSVDQNERLLLPTKDEAVQMLQSVYDSFTGENVSAPQLQGEIESIQDNEDSLFGILSESILNSTKNELDQFLEEPVSPQATLPLQYWECNKARLPVLSVIAKKFIAIPATSGGVERVFSIAGSIGRARRSSISASNIANLLLHREYNAKKGIKRKLSTVE